MNVELLDLHPAPADLEQLVREGMTAIPRQLPAWLLYDSEGSRLFAAICEQPEYSLTRTEIALLNQQAEAISASLGSGVLVEFGIGNARKVSPLLKALNSDLFVGLDISRTALRDALDNCRFANAGFTNEDGVVFGSATQHLQCATNLIIAANDRIQFTHLRPCCEINGVFFERLTLLLRIR